MKVKLSKILILFISLIISSCAATYKPINPRSLNYNKVDSDNSISIGYRYDVLSERGNSKYAKKEKKNGIDVVAIQITNNTDNVINVGRDCEFYVGQRPITPMGPQVVHGTIKQLVPAYAPYLLLTLTKFYVSNGYSTTVYPIGLLLGPGITIGNMALAGSSNKKMLMELMSYNILEKDIQKGETVYGIIGIRDSGYGPITIKKKN